MSQFIIYLIGYVFETILKVSMGYKKDFSRIKINAIYFLLNDHPENIISEYQFYFSSETRILSASVL